MLSPIGFINRGITYAVLKYRMPHGHVEIIREDIREAIRLIRARSAEWGDSTGRSDGGFYRRVYCRYGCNFVPWNGPRRFPDSALSGDQHDGPTDTFALAMQNVRREYSRSRKKALSLELHVTKETSSAFIVLAEDDQTVSPLNSLAYYTALLKHGVSAELHIYPQRRTQLWVLRQLYIQEPMD